MQLQQSGLLQQLPALLSAVTQELQVEVALSVTDGQASHPNSSTTTVGQTAWGVLGLTAYLLKLRPELNAGAHFVPLPAAAGLIVSSIRFLTHITAPPQGT
jgi:hypothetical protein